MDAVVFVEREPRFRLEGEHVIMEIASGNSIFCYAMPVSVLTGTVALAQEVVAKWRYEKMGERSSAIPIKRGRRRSH